MDTQKHQRRFFDLLEAINGAAEVCPKPEIPTPSEWAKSALGFEPDAKQAAVLDHDAHRLILCCARQWGKTTVIGIKALHAAIFHPGTQIAIISKSLKHAGILIDRVRQSAAILGLPRKRVLGHDHSLELPNGSRIFGIANAESAIRGYTIHIVIVDEAAQIQDDVIGAASPTLGRTNGKLWLLSTPHGQTGLFFNVWHNESLSDWFKMKATIEDSPYASPAFIEEQKRLFPYNFRQEFYCEFTPAKGRLLDHERVNKMIDPSIPYVPFPRLSKEAL
jgi:hypothetical protein